MIERSSLRRAAVIFRLLSKEHALQVFDGLGHTMQSELFRGLRDEDVAALFAELQPDDRVGLIDELPAVVAQRALTGLSPHERAMTMVVLGYPAKSVGRRMSPEYVRTHPDLTVAETLDIVRERAPEAETIYTIPVTDRQKMLVGVVSLRDLIESEPQQRIAELMSTAESARAGDSAESAARLCTDLDLLALPMRIRSCGTLKRRTQREQVGASRCGGRT